MWKPVVLCALSLFEPGPSAVSPPVTPVDGVVDLQEEEMAQSVLGRVQSLNACHFLNKACLQYHAVLFIRLVSLKNTIGSHGNICLLRSANMIGKKGF